MSSPVYPSFIFKSCPITAKVMAASSLNVRPLMTFLISKPAAYFFRLTSPLSADVITNTVTFFFTAMFTSCFFQSIGAVPLPLAFIIKIRFPLLYRFYFRETTFDRLEKAFKLAHIVSVDNDSQIIPLLYNKGKRIFIIKARGSGTAPIDWKKQLVNIVVKKNVTVLVITSADSGDVNLKKYAAGLDIKKVISGRTLREEAAMTLAVIGHDLKMNEGYTGDDIQQLIDRFCYLSGMIGD